MARVLVTGSTDGLGLMAARLLTEQGHTVTAHARDERRAEDVRSVLDVEAVAVGDLWSIAGMRAVADQVNALGRHDAVVHNAAVGYREPRRISTPDGLAHVFAVNVLAPYVLTALIERPYRLVYLSSGMQRGGSSDLSDAQWEHRRWNGSQAYADSKLFDTMLAFAGELRRSRLGGDQDGRSRRAGRPGRWGGDAGMARRQPRSGRLGHRRALLSPAPAPQPPRRALD
jgi:NAD(P)-dependent dehydrogenase (short-subunit alcohol dehydrogenase family)